MKVIPQSNFIKAKVNVQDGDTIKLINEGNYVDILDRTTGKKKKVLQFEVELEDGETKTYTMNNTTQINLTQEWGNDSKKWIGKPLRAWIVRQMAFGKLTNVLILTPESWTDIENKIPKETIGEEETAEADEEMPDEEVEDENPIRDEDIPI
jgi:hypothetical protein